MESLKQDAAELKDIAKGPGSAADKAKAAAKAVKQPGRQEAEHGAASEPSVSTPPPSTPPPAPPTA